MRGPPTLKSGGGGADGGEVRAILQMNVILSENGIGEDADSLILKFVCVSVVCADNTHNSTSAENRFGSQGAATKQRGWIRK